MKSVARFASLAFFAGCVLVSAVWTAPEPVSPSPAKSRVGGRGPASVPEAVTSQIVETAQTSADNSKSRSRAEGMRPNSRKPIEDRAERLRESTRFTTSVFSRKMDHHQACRESNECLGDMLCLQGRCRKLDPQNRGGVGESCSGPEAGRWECISGVCTDNVCAATLEDRADNGSEVGLDALCRSNTRRGGICVPSPKFPGLPGDSCTSPGDCVSRSCTNDSRDGEKRCGFSLEFAATCAGVGIKVRSGLECCSSVMDGSNRCQAIGDPNCTEHGDCSAAVGRTCADIGAVVMSPTQCCSGRSQNQRCVIDTARAHQPCRLDRACRTGECDQKSNLCSVPGRAGTRRGYPIYGDGSN